jgi:hypothetical protein
VNFMVALGQGMLATDPTRYLTVTEVESTWYGNAPSFDFHRPKMGWFATALLAQPVDECKVSTTFVGVV